MVRRLARWATALVVASLGVLPSLSRAGAVNGDVRLLGQSPVATLSNAGTARISLSLHASGAMGQRIEVALLPRLTSREGLDAFLATPGGTPSSTTAAVLTCSTTVRLVVTLSATGGPGGGGSCVRSPLVVRLPYPTSAAGGVYPLRITLSGISAHPIWSLVTVHAPGAKTGTPLRVVWLAVLDPTSASTPTSPVTLTALAQVRDPVSVTADYRVLNIVNQMNGTPLHDAVSTLLQRGNTESVGALPGDVDLGGLVANGFASQVSRQLNESATLVHDLGGRPLAQTLYLETAPGAGELAALTGAGQSRLLVSPGALDGALGTAWGLPFSPTDSTLTAAATDPALTKALEAHHDPVSRAMLAVGALHFLQATVPASAGRTVVLSPAVRTTPAPLVASFFRAVHNDPTINMGTVDGAVSPELVGRDGAPTTHALLSMSTPAWNGRNAASYADLVAQTRSFTSAIDSTSVAASLRVNSLQAALVGSPAERQAAIARAQAALGVQINQFRIDTSPVTLTGSGTALPVTLYSRAPYAVTAVVRVLTDRIDFPRGSTVPVTLDAPTRSLRIATGAHRGSSATVRIELTTPDGAVLLARAAVLVNVAGTSVVGWILSGSSLVVIAAWWLRTARRRSRSKR